ncbi:segregation/condensation protein A [Romeria aff. gracilis LEGE 07310]|uniref:Segregation and condensation protein A n=1 Tax=Vasconcelosia minhoensis LEGE 07310 TaxID=915328 RepID=A0A8J7DQ72_9CYAN|nr:segregation/condensation protein A [Romeria gracilis]MBE9076024.1 segregation/condensation protein A [Romeria aff. gracilis LEGE 07310]
MARLAESAIAFLIDLAEQGEIDPWNVNVIDVIDRFLTSLKTQPAADPTKTGRSPYETSLSESGQAFLYASMLVLLKADTLIRTEVEAEEEGFEEDFFEPADFVPVELPRHLERHIHRRAVAPPPEKRKVTLDELIGQLELIAAAMADATPRSRSRRPQPQSRRQAVRAIAQLAHQENLSEIAAALETFLDQHWDRLGDAEWMDFDRLLAHWAHFRPEVLGGAIEGELSVAEDKHERVGVFWGLLFLSAQSKVELHQDAFYQDLKVRQLTDVAELEANLETTLGLND